MRAVNLIPSEQRSEGAVANRSQGAAYFVLVLLGGLAVLALLYGSAHRQIANRRAEVATLTARVHQVQTEASQLAPYASFASMREQRLQAISQLVNARFDWANVMRELSRVLPSDVSLSSMVGTIGASAATATATTATPTTGSPTEAASAGSTAASVTSATPPGATPTITLSGCAVSQATVAQTLVRLRLIGGVSGVTLQNSGAGGGGGGGSTSSSGGCSNEDPTFSLQVNFEALPSIPAASVQTLESTTTASNPGGSASRGAATVSDSGAGRAR
jgi:Tfp pilus assembly protein PilN